MAIRVVRDRIIVGAISSFRVNGLEVGATTGEATVRRNVEFYDVEVEQAFGTLRKSLTTDKRFLDLSLAEANLENLHLAWNDEGGVVRSYSDRIAHFAVKGAGGVDGPNADENAFGLATDGNNLFMTGERLSRITDLGLAEPIKAANAAAPPTTYGVAGLTVANIRDATVFGDYIYVLEAGTAAKIHKVALSTGVKSATFTLTGFEVPDDVTAGVPVGVGGITNNDAGDLFVTDGIKVIKIAASVVAGNTDAAIAAANQTAVGTTISLDGTTVVSLSGTPATARVGVIGITGLAYDSQSKNVYAVNKANRLFQMENILTLGTTGAVVGSPVGAATNYGVLDSDGTTSAVSSRGAAFYDNEVWVLDGTADAERLIRVAVIGRNAGIGRPVGDVDEMKLNNPAAQDLENEIKLITPGSNGRFRAYKFPICVSMTEGEHMYQKAGTTMIPLSFEVLVDPNNDEGHYGVIKDFPTLAEAEAF